MLQRLASIRLTPIQLTWAAALFFATIGNLALWRVLWTLVELDSARSVLVLLSLPVVLFCLFNIMLSPLLTLPYLRVPLLSLLLLASAACSYFMVHYGVLIDRSMVQNVFETNQAEFASYLSVPLLLTLLFLGVLPAAAGVLASAPHEDGLLRSVLQWSANVLATLVVLAALAMLFYKDYASLVRNHRELRDQVLPLAFVRNTNGYLQRKYRATSQPLRVVGEDAVRPAGDGNRPRLVIVVVGETARARNFQLNGYGRATNPALAKRNDVISFKQVRSCGTATAISVPCMFSRLRRQDYDDVRAATEENLLDVLQRTGVRLLWRNNNNGGCKGVCARVPTEDMPVQKVAGLCTNADGTCLDEILLHRLDAQIDAMPGDALVVLHQLGSHGPTYYERYPADARTFTPTCDTNRIQKCTNDALTNTYDNTLVYTDRMLDRTIDLLERYADQRDVAMIYVSDHGESLGERGLFLHGTPYVIAPEEQTHVPLLAWFSPGFARSAQLDLSCLRARADHAASSHDNVYHSLLGLFDVQTRVYDSELDLFAACRHR